LGSVFLVVTGGEALYADMGHFGRKPITIAWYGVAIPGLMLNYFGQGALLLTDPESVENPFYYMVPRALLWPMVVLATIATVIASQALISGAFSLTKQGVQLGFLPRVKITQTSEEERGQIYVPLVNWALLVACVGLVIGFGKSSNLAAAYGLAVTGTMAITTLLFRQVATSRFGWPHWRANLVCGLFLVGDLAFLGANIPKIPHGGWFPLMIGGLLLVVFTTWSGGRRLLAERLASKAQDLRAFASEFQAADQPRSPGVGVYMGSNPATVPTALYTHYSHAAVLPKTVCVVSVKIDEVPHVDLDNRVTIEPLGAEMYLIIGSYGYMDEIDVPEMLAEAASPKMHLDFSHATYILGRENPKATKRDGMALWRERLFVFMQRNASTADLYFKLPPDRTLELGVQVDL
jgi:KUP system potassium uptake protein